MVGYFIEKFALHHLLLLDETGAILVFSLSDYGSTSSPVNMLDRRRAMCGASGRLCRDAHNDLATTGAALLSPPLRTT